MQKESLIFNKFKTFLLNNTSIINQEWKQIEKILKLKTFKKKDTILYAGNICDKIRFVNIGISRMYYFNEEGKEFTCHIAYNETENLIDNFAIDYHSFSTQTPTIYEIEALSDMEIVEINFDDLHELSSKTKVLEELSEKARGIMYSTVRDSLIDKNILSNKQRYNDFIQRYGKIHDLIPQYIVASYLGITPVALSRLKNK